MSEEQQQMALARQFVLRWSSNADIWTREQIRIVAMAMLYGEQAGLASGAAIADEAFERMAEGLREAVK